jgi:hypothetical protein
VRKIFAGLFIRKASTQVKFADGKAPTMMPHQLTAEEYLTHC